MLSTVGKVTPLTETYTFSRFPTRLPNYSTYSVWFLKRQRAWSSALVQPWTRLHKSAKVNTGLVVKWQLFRTWRKERRMFWVAPSECFLSWLLTTGVNKGPRWEALMSDVFMPGWGNWMAAECSHAGPPRPEPKTVCLFVCFEEAGPERRTCIIWMKRLACEEKEWGKHPVYLRLQSLSARCYAEVNHTVWV